MNAKILCSLLFCFGSLHAFEITKWSDLPEGGIIEDTNGTFAYTGDNPDILNHSLFFLNPQSKLSIRFDISGDNWQENQCGLIFCIKQDEKFKNATFNTGTMEFFINSSAKTVTGTSPFSLFELQDKTSLDSAANLFLQISQTSLFDSVFSLNEATLTLENADVVVDISHNVSRKLFKASGKSRIEINQGGNQNKQTIQLGGDIDLKGSSSLNLHLGNQNSYFRGKISTSDRANVHFTLHNSHAWIEEFSQNSNVDSTFTLYQSNLYGTATAQNGNASLNMALQNSQWQVFNNSQIANLTLANSDINFMFDSFGFRLGRTHTQKTLQAKALNGNGRFLLYADVSQKTIDTTSFATAKGEQSVFIFYNPTTFTQQAAENITIQDNMVVATITEQNDDAVFVGEETDLGIASYKANLTKVTKEGRTQWIISSITQNQESTTAKILTTALNSPYRMTTLLSQTLNQRLGDLREYPKDYGLYFHYLIGQNALSGSSNTLQTKDFYMDFSFGFDSNTTSKNATTFLGLGFDVLLFDSKNSFYTNQAIALSPTLYWTGILKNRFYYDVVLRYIYTDGNFDIASPSLDTQTSLSSHSVLLSGEIGWKLGFWNQSNFFFLEPQTKLDVGAIFTSTIKLKDIYQQDIKAKTEVQFPLLSKTSLLLGYEYNLENLKGDVKIGPFFTYALQSGATTILQDLRSRFTKKFKDDFDVGLNISSNLLLQDYLRFYLEFDSSFLGQYRQDFVFNAGIRWSFGERYIPPPPPPADPKRFKIRYKYKDRRTIPEVRENEVENMKHYNNQGEIKRSYFYPKPQTLKK